MAKFRCVVLLVCLGFLSFSPVADTSFPEPHYPGLGDYTRPMKTSSPQAQVYFDQGLAFLFAFNHDEAVRSFRAAASLDPAAAMPQWGIALALGPHINNSTMAPAQSHMAVQAIREAIALAGNSPPVDRALISALAARYADPQPEDRAELDRAYAEAMADVWERFPEDADVGALYAEALANLHPWDLWDEHGAPKPGTLDLTALLERVLASAPRHPLANHLYIHAVEASPEPGRADASADMLRDLQPGLGHLVHMPSHIDVRRGRWPAAILANARAIEADRRYTRLAPEQGFYRLYMAHNHHMLAFAAMMSGQSDLAQQSIEEMVADIPAEFFRDNAFADGMMAMPLEVHMRFGRWERILQTPIYPDYVPLSRALQRYARAVAYAALGRVADAQRERAAFTEARARVPEDTTFGNNRGDDLLAVAERLMTGEILYREGRKEEGLAALAAGAALEDSLRYDEPPGWIQPVRHPWGAALLQSGHAEEAEAVFREDLQRQPENGWGLYGLMRALQLQGRKEEAAEVEKRFDAVWKDADVRIKSPCLCFPGV